MEKKLVYIQNQAIFQLDTVLFFKCFKDNDDKVHVTYKYEDEIILSSLSVENLKSFLNDCFIEVKGDGDKDYFVNKNEIVFITTFQKFNGEKVLNKILIRLSDGSAVIGEDTNLSQFYLKMQE